MDVFPIEKTSALILSYPDNQVQIELLNWLAAIGIRDVHTVLPPVRGISIGYNRQLAAALDSPADYFLFCEKDMKPDIRDSALFLDLAGDIVACEYETECSHDRSWGEVTSFHTGLWRTSRAVLEKIEKPYFLPCYNEDATDLLTCTCGRFRDQALKAGFSIRHGGWAHHKPKI
jgi:hypothetical protein